jgi:X-Pro dipeptidyl-peptidase
MAAVVGLTVLPGTAPAATGPVDTGGETRPVYPMSAAVRQTVYVEAPMDSDHDGRRDRIAVAVLRPAETAHGMRVATVLQASPYTGRDPNGGTGPVPDPGVFAEWYAGYFVPRGYAFAEVEMAGTGRSQGCPTTGGLPDTLSATTAIGWLTGRARAFDAPTGGNPVRAGWSTGAVGMIGLSYDGTLAEAAATTGIAGLRTIVPEAAISSWYDYARDQGIAYPAALGDRYPEYQADRVVSDAARPKCAATLTALGDSAADGTADYTPFWAARNYRVHDNRIRASVLLAQGLTDPKVFGREFAAFWSDLARYHVSRRLWLHQGGHEDPIGTGGAAWQETVHRWMDHWLYGLDNGVMNDPSVTIERPDGTWETHDVWPDPADRTVRLPIGGRFTDDHTQREATMIADPTDPAPHRLVALTDPVGVPTRLSGTATIDVRMTAEATSTPLTALLVDYGPDVSAGKEPPGKPPAALPIVARGSVDVKNRYSLSHPVPLVPGRYYDVRWQLQATDYLFAAGHRIGLVLVANDVDRVLPDPAAAGIAIDPEHSAATLPLVG